MDDEKEQAGLSVKLPPSAWFFQARDGLKSAELEPFHPIPRPACSRTRFSPFILFLYSRPLYNALQDHPPYNS